MLQKYGEKSSRKNYKELCDNISQGLLLLKMDSMENMFRHMLEHVSPYFSNCKVLLDFRTKCSINCVTGLSVTNKKSSTKC